MQIRDGVFKGLCQLAENYKNVIMIIADQGGYGVETFRHKFPERFINVGVAEQNAINVASGLALGGKRPFIYSIASFILQRPFEQIRLATLMQLPIVILALGYGDGYWWDGPTHCIPHDRQILDALGIAIYTPLSPVEAETDILNLYEKKQGVSCVRIKKE